MPRRDFNLSAATGIEEIMEKTDMDFAAKFAEVPLWGKKLITIDGEDVVLINDKGTISACENYSPHQ